MIPYFQYSEINLGFITIQFWGLCVALGFVLGLMVLYYEMKRKGIDPKMVFDLGLVAIISAFVGARLYYVLNEFSYFIKNPVEIFKLWEGGSGFYGGLLFAAFFSYLYLRKKKIPFWPVTDSVAISLALGQAVGRIGCFFIHDHLGKPTNFFLGIEYQGVVRHETSLYSFISCLILFIILLVIRKKPISVKAGFLSSLYLIWQGLTSFFIYGLRATDLPGSDQFWGFLRPSQYFSALLFFIGLILLFWAIKKKSTVLSGR